MDDLQAFEAALAARAAEVEAALDALLPQPDGPESRLGEAMRYVALGGGKRLRGFLALESAALFGAPPSAARRAAAAVECVHAYSLAHDDLPAMDDDDLRRGRSTAHVAFDEATAILAGDALQTIAFEIALTPEPGQDSGAQSVAFALALAEASGLGGMAGGQMIDIVAERRAQAGDAAFDLDVVGRLQAMKTGALIRVSAEAGPILAGAGPEARAALRAYAEALGRAFQIRDDLLDIEGDEAAMGKRLGKDAGAGKGTFVSLLGEEGARAEADRLVGAAEAALERFGPRATLLRQAARFSVARTR